jgi:hypothetical protein
MNLIDSLQPKDPAAAASLTLHEYVSNRSVALLLRSRPGQLEIASGTSVKIGDHLLVATAAHNVDGLKPRDLEVIPAGRRTAKDPRVLGIGLHRLWSQDYIDVAWLELESAGKSSEMWFVRLEEIEPLNPEDEVHPVLLQGYPCASVEVPAQYQDRPVVESVGLMTLSVQPAHRRTVHHAGIDIALEFPPHDGSLNDANLPPPAGISGGGLWLVPRFANHAVWSPELAKLVGIGRAWWREPREFVGTRIEEWLELVAHDFPDIQSEILARMRKPIASRSFVV